MNDWQQLLDEDSGAYYFFNPHTGASSWEEPAGWNAGANAAAQMESSGARTLESKDAAATKSDAPPGATDAAAFRSSSSSAAVQKTTVQTSTRKKVKHVPWTKAYTYNGLKPWPCPLCKKVNRS